MSIVSTHVCCSYIFAFVGKVIIELEHRESVHICSEGNTVILAFLFSLSIQVNDHPCWPLSLLADLPNALFLDSQLKQNGPHPFVGLKLPKGNFRVLVKLSSEVDNPFKQCFIHQIIS